MREIIRIIIVEDQTPVRHGLRDLLNDEPDFEVVGEASDGTEAVEVTGKLKPDVVVTGLRMPRLAGIRITEQVRESSPNTRIVILSMYSDKAYMDAAFQAGALGYVVKESSANGLVDTIRRVAAGER
ncbi:MAG: response regulator transcription factor [Dehalococcoidia bacterium]